ncbi:MAG TPA: hypothetical protein DDW66_10785, partial [Porphyromonadaceae bacterium]|nr:hypothetical protein [Porphyromonadaceae bacterium]
TRLSTVAVFMSLMFFMANGKVTSTTKNIKLMKTATVDNLVKIQFLDTHTAKLVLMFSVLLSAANFIAPFV